MRQLESCDICANNYYLADINEQAEERMLLLMQQMAEQESLTEHLKAQDQMLWFGT